MDINLYYLALDFPPREMAIHTRLILLLRLLCAFS